MLKGTIMLLATLVSNAYASTPVQEANELRMSKSLNERNINVLELQTMIAKLDEKKSKLDKTIFEAKQAYFALSEDKSIFEMEQYEDLQHLDLALRGISSHLKKEWSNHSEEILVGYGKDVHERFKYLIAKTGQLRKNISNILRIGVEIKGLVVKVQENAFTPSKEFMIAADLATKQVYIH